MASYNAPAPSITNYSWVFGNGQTSSIANPENILFDAPGLYPVALTTTVSTPTLDELFISGLSNNWSGDVEENAFFGGDPDVFFTLLNGDSVVVFTSESIANNQNPSWILSPINLNEPPYTLVFYDEDPVSDDDLLGVFTLTQTSGNHSFTSAEGTSGNYEIGQLITTQITDSTIIQVFPLPDSVLTLNNNIATIAEPNFSSIVWFQDGSITDEFIASTAVLTTGGVYSAEVTNLYGCSAVTNSVTYCAPVVIEYIPTAQELFVPDNFASYQWYFNGVAMKGGNNYYISTNEPGNYSVSVTTDYGCVTESEIYVLVISVEEQESTLINLFPIPTHDMINVQLKTPAPWAITDVTGRTVMSKHSIYSVFTINVEALPAGVYFFHTNESRTRFVKE
jgi:PKD repeat protein